MNKHSREVIVPDIGDFDAVDVVEVLVKEGQVVAIDDPLITLESDKASMEVPSDAAGVVLEVRVRLGDRVGQGAVIVVLEETAGPEVEPAASESSDPPGVPVAAPANARVAAASAAAENAPAGGGSDSSPGPAGAASSIDSSNKYDFDVVVIGAGPGGYSAAFRAADLGQRTALVERDPMLGGVCLNVGCIPSKALLHAAKVIDDAAAFAEHGVVFGNPKISLGKLRAWKDAVVGKLVGGLSGLAKVRQVEVVRGTATFRSAHELVVRGESGERTFSFANAIIAAGSEPVQLPGIPQDGRIIDSTGALELPDVPAKLLVIGGGIIGLEMATVYAALGSRVSVVELLDGLMPGTDRDLVRPLEKRITKRYEKIWTKTKVTAVKAQKNGLRAYFEGPDAPQSALFDRILVAVGRRPNGRLLGAENAGIHVDERGFIPVDSQQRTNVPHIFAVGDVASLPMLAHKASYEGKVAAEVAAGHKSGFDARVIPSVAYTDPEVAWVGVTETEAKATGRRLEKSVFPWSASGRSLSLGRDEGLTKLLFDPDTRRLVGGGVVGPHAGDLIAEIGLAIEMGADGADLALTIHPHPTLSETVMLAAEVFEGTVTDIYLPSRKRSAGSGSGAK